MPDESVLRLFAKNAGSANGGAQSAGGARRSLLSIVMVPGTVARAYCRGQKGAPGLPNNPLLLQAIHRITARKASQRTRFRQKVLASDSWSGRVGVRAASTS